MILSLDLNPKICREFSVEDFSRGRDSIALENKIYSKGDGLCAAEFIKRLNEDVTLMALIGGVNGELIKDGFKENPLKLKEIKIKDNNQEEILIAEKKRNTKISSKFPRITREELDQFLSEYKEALKNTHIVCMPTIDNPNIGEDFLENIIKLAATSSIKMAINLSKGNIENLAKHSPYLVVITKDQLETFSNLNLNFTSEVVKAGELLLQMGVGVVVVTSENKGAVVVSKFGNYTLTFGEMTDEIISIDHNLLAAGIALGISRDYDYETWIKLGIASGIASELIEPGNVNMAEIKKIMYNIQLKETKRRIL